MEWLNTFLGTALSGGVTGLLGTIFTGITTYLDKRSARQHELELYRLQIEERKTEGEIYLKQATVQVEGAIAMGELNAFTTSLSSDRATYATDAGDSWVFIIVDGVRGLMRPVLTTLLALAVIYLAVDVVEAVGGWDVVVKSQGMGLVSTLIDALTYCTVTAVVWWFGGRATQKGLGRM
ncbi:TM Helix protein [Vibrio phage LV6]|nr:TM Helix protein [Vibrio phage LV6]